MNELTEVPVGGERPPFFPGFAKALGGLILVVAPIIIALLFFVSHP